MQISKIVNDIYGKIFGWFELVASKGGSDYKYVIESIKLVENDNSFFTIIYYKMVGVRTLRYDKAIELNSSHIFSLFKPEHAQLIVSIATAEALLNKSPLEVIEKYKKYVSGCSLKLSERAVL